MSGKRIRVDKAIVLSEENIIIVRFLPGCKVEFPDVLPVIDAVRDFEQSDKHGILIDVREMEYISSEARTYFAKEKGRTIVANALLVRSPIQQTLANLYFKFANPVIETRMFTSEDDAKEWLLSKLTV